MESVDARTAPPAQIFAGLLAALDERDWSGARTLMTEEVQLDYQSLFGAAPGPAPADEVVAQWASMLDPLDMTQHLLGTPTVKIEGDQASLSVPVRGYHVAHGLPDGEEWMVAGRYHAGLWRSTDGWRLWSLRLDAQHQTGNRALLAQAGERSISPPLGEGFRCTAVRFGSMGERLAGHLYLPDDAEGPLPGVVLLAPATGLKDHGTAESARALVRCGLMVLVYDERGRGESSGRGHDPGNAEARLQDLHAAASRLGRHPRLLGDGVAVLAIGSGPLPAPADIVDGTQVDRLAVLGGELEAGDQLPSSVRIAAGQDLASVEDFLRAAD